MENKYNVIYIDPPWETKAGRKLISNKEGVFMSEDMKPRKLAYPTISTEKIKNLPIKNLASEDCHLYVWVINSHLPFVFEIIKEWGFKYSTTLVWAKNKFGGGLGGSFPITTEFLIFARKGKLKALKRNEGSWFNVKRTYENGKPKHSKKPVFFYELIENTSPGKKIEIFARNKRDGWDSWGNEVENSIELEVTQ